MLRVIILAYLIVIGQLSEVPNVTIHRSFNASGKSAMVNVEDHVRWPVQTLMILFSLAAGPFILVISG